MSVKNYRFVSPGVFVNEIDNSQLPASPAGIGPVVIGRAASGPALRPVRVSSFSEFVRIFGNPSPGDGANDVWRQGSNVQAPTYGMYAAQAYLRNSSPLTYIRLLGAEAPNADGTGGQGGWTESSAYGLIIFQNSASYALTGALAAVFYTNAATVVPQVRGYAASSSVDGIQTSPTDTSGTIVASTSSVEGTNVLVANENNNNTEFKVVITNAATSPAHLTASFNFDISSPKYIRKVFNTNPEALNSGITDGSNLLNYFLGETFDRHVTANITKDNTFATIVTLKRNEPTAMSAADHQSGVLSAQTPWIIGCDIGDGQIPQLLKFHGLDQPGDWTNKNLKISIQDIKVSTNDSTDYGTFSVVVRRLDDSDNVVQVVEQFNDCDLNPNSLNYVCRKVGDKYREWVDDERRYRERGSYENNSAYIRVEVNPDVEAGNLNANYLPFGFKGIVKYKDDVIGGYGEITGQTLSGSWITGSLDGREELSAHTGYTTGSIFIVQTHEGTGIPWSSQVSYFSASVLYPSPEYRVSASDGNLASLTDAYWGFQTGRSAGSTIFDSSNIDTLRPRGGIVGEFTAGTSAEELATTFTLDDLSGTLASGITSWNQDSLSEGTSLSATRGYITGVLDQGFDRFTVPLYGGFDGMEINEMDPFANRNLTGTPTDANNYVFNSIRRAIDSVADPEVVEMNLATIPGLTQEGLTTNLVNLCEDRADALAIIDLPDGFRARAESTTKARNNLESTITTTVNGLRSRGLNSSYGCCFYPWVRARDTIGGAMVWLPPSVAALGTFSSSQRKTDVWFAPAGFNRGGLTEGSAGIPVMDVAHQLRRKDRDTLYAANINPIAKFPAEGIVIFGQKTLQVTPSALDRINVRRLMIFVKKRISQMATSILFDPNVKTTWARFTSMVDPFLADVKTNFGLSDYKVVLDESTTTADLIDRNILYAKIFLKPTRAIEFIAIDFNITRTGASFDD